MSSETTTAEPTALETEVARLRAIVEADPGARARAADLRRRTASATAQGAYLIDDVVERDAALAAMPDDQLRYGATLVDVSRWLRAISECTIPAVAKRLRANPPHGNAVALLALQDEEDAPTAIKWSQLTMPSGGFWSRQGNRFRCSIKEANELHALGWDATVDRNTEKATAAHLGFDGPDVVVMVADRALEILLRHDARLQQAIDKGQVKVAAAENTFNRARRLEEIHAQARAKGCSIDIKSPTQAPPAPPPPPDPYENPQHAAAVEIARRIIASNGGYK